VFKIIQTLALVIMIVLFPPAALITLSQNAVPGDMAYPIKIKLEDAVLFLASFNPVTKAWFALAQTNRRYVEASALLDKGIDASESLQQLVAQADITAGDISRLQNASEKEKIITDLTKQITTYNENLSQTQTRIDNQLLSQGVPQSVIDDTDEVSPTQKPQQTQEPQQTSTPAPSTGGTPEQTKEPTPTPAATATSRPTPRPTQSPQDEELLAQQRAIEEAKRKLEELKRKLEEEQKRLKEQQQKDAAKHSPTPTATPKPSPSPSPTPKPSPSPSKTPAPTPTPSPSQQAVSTAGFQPSPSPVSTNNPKDKQNFNPKWNKNDNDPSNDDDNGDDDD
jgi:hypothetical protein